MYRTVIQAFEELTNRQSLSYEQQQVATTRIRTIREFMAREFQLRETPFLAGSYARSTICSQERDIDIMAPFEPYGRNSYWERYKSDSRLFLYWVRDALNSRYATTNVSSKQVAVTLDFTSIKVDLVPCFPRQGGGYLIPNGTGGWIGTNPKYHTQVINNRNTILLNKLKPTIKLTKAWNNANGRHLRSFHIEMMVESMWREASSIPIWPNAIQQIITTLPSWINSPFPDPWDSSRNIDDYLTFSQRQQVLRMLTQDTAAAEEAERYRLNSEDEKAFERWDVIFRHTFPSRVGS